MKLSKLVTSLLLSISAITVYATSPVVPPYQLDKESLQHQLLNSEELTIEEGNERDSLRVASDFIDSLSHYPAY